MTPTEPRETGETTGCGARIEKAPGIHAVCVRVPGHSGEHSDLGWSFDPPRQCGGVFTNGKEPGCCEVHLAPWGHARPECAQ